jgi:hypothetical protein
MRRCMRDIGFTPGRNQPRDRGRRRSPGGVSSVGVHPGVFVADRDGSIERVASAVGEGAMAASLIHRYLAQERLASRT